MGFTLRKKPPTYFIVHCTASNFGTEKIVNEWHLKRWSTGTGYHYLITNEYPYSTKSKPEPCLDGQIVSGRPLKYTGAHCKGHNYDSVGVVLFGANVFTKKQFSTLRTLYQYVCAYYDKKLIIKGHRDFDKNKTCPNFNAQDIISIMKKSQVPDIDFRYIKNVDSKLANLHRRLKIVEKKVIHVP